MQTDDDYLTSESVRREHRVKCLKNKASFEKIQKNIKVKKLKGNNRNQVKHQMWKELDNEDNF